MVGENQDYRFKAGQIKYHEYKIKFIWRFAMNREEYIQIMKNLKKNGDFSYEEGKKMGVAMLNGELGSDAQKHLLKHSISLDEIIDLYGKENLLVQNITEDDIIIFPRALLIGHFTEEEMTWKRIELILLNFKEVLIKNAMENNSSHIYEVVDNVLYCSTGELSVPEYKSNQKDVISSKERNTQKNLRLFYVGFDFKEDSDCCQYTIHTEIILNHDITFSIQCFGPEITKSVQERMEERLKIEWRCKDDCD